ncbi:ABC transporter permease [Paenibacillus hexagrammi]|uniref:ABC transporter permease n=1 Tax=Paenibacillus hexagrammi TaxID=2908839 RepID=A0ABY3SG63_9BACL|nr:ABC transporter permease [Paenibacillus sp. YPD9-1]UJF32704.1 ABC transporter permease [Paenibacillus sp. YPD9-1]
MKEKLLTAPPVTGGTHVSQGRLPFRLVRQSTGRSPWWIPIASVVLALLFCALFLAWNGMNPLIVYSKMFQGAFGSKYGWSETLVKAIPLLLCGIGVAVAYRIHVWNIGAEGQFVAGAIAATAVTVYAPGLPGSIAIPLMLVAGIAAGALWGLLTAIPKVYFQVNELITSLMLNYIALSVLDFVVFGPWKDPKGFNFPGTPMFTPGEQLLTFFGTRVHLGLIYGLLAVLLFAFIVYRTKWGYEWKLLGSNPHAAEYAGIRIKKHVLLVMLISGGVAGLAGMCEVSGVAHRLLYGISPGYGYTAIIVACLAKLNPFGMILSSILFGGLLVGGYSVQSIGLPPSMSLMLQGAILFFVIGGEQLSRYRLVTRKRDG